MSQDKLHRIITHFIEDNISDKSSDRLLELYNDYPNRNLIAICAYFHQNFNRLFDFLNQKMKKVNRHYNADESRELLRLIEQFQILQDKCSAVKLEIILISAYQEIVDECQKFLQESDGSPIPKTFQKIKLISYDPVIQIKSTEQTVREYINQKSLQEEELPISEAVRRKVIKDKSQLGIRWENDLSKEDFIAPFSFRDKFDETLTPDDFIDYAESGFLYPLNLGLLDFDEVLMWLEPQELLAFLCRSIHPAVRPDSKEEVEKLRSCFNRYLEHAGYEIFVAGQDSGGDVFGARRIGIKPQLSPETKAVITRSDIKDKIDKCEKLFTSEDYEDVMINSHTLLEECACDIYRRKTSKELLNFNRDFEKHFPHFIEECYGKTNDAATEKLHKVAVELYRLRHILGEGHAKKLKSKRKPTSFEARTHLNATITILDYLYSSNTNFNK